MNQQSFDIIAYICIPMLLGGIWGWSSSIEECKEFLTEATNKFLAWFVVFIVIPIGVSIPYVGIMHLIKQIIF